MACKASLDSMNVSLILKSVASRSTLARSESGSILQAELGKQGISNLKLQCTVFPESERIAEISVQDGVMSFKFWDLIFI